MPFPGTVARARASSMISDAAASRSSAPAGSHSACSRAYPVRGVVDVDQPLFVRPFAELAHSLAAALRGGDFDTAFEPFRQSIGVDRLPEPERSRILARQRIRQDLVVGYWDEMLHSTPEQLQARIDDTVRIQDRSRIQDPGSRIQDPFLAVFGHVGSAIAFALDGPMAQAAYQQGLDPAAFGFWRASAGAMLLGGCLVARAQPLLPGSGGCAGRPPFGWRWRPWQD